MDRAFGLAANVPAHESCQRGDAPEQCRRGPGRGCPGVAGKQELVESERRTAKQRETGQRQQGRLPNRHGSTAIHGTPRNALREVAKGLPCER